MRTITALLLSVVLDLEHRLASFDVRLILVALVVPDALLDNDPLRDIEYLINDTATVLEPHRHP